MNQPLVSILIPAYNSELYLAETLDSALAQTWPSIEIIVVDDGSKDNTLAVAKKYESRNVQVLAQIVNQGQTAALNRCLAAAQGDFIQYFDADDILEPRKIQIQVERLMQAPPDTLAIAPWARFHQNDLTTAKFVPNRDWQDYNDPIAWLVDGWSGHGTMPPGSWLYPRGIVEQIGTWDERLSLNNDMEYFTRAVLASKQLLFCPEAVWYYRSGNPSLSGQRSAQALWSQYEVIRLSTERLLAVENSDRTRYAAACYWQYFIFMTFPQTSELTQYAEKQVQLLGGCDLKPDGGKLFKLIREILGWKVAMRWQKLYYRYRYQI